jgi:hypothetical protein
MGFSWWVAHRKRLQGATRAAGRCKRLHRL